MPSHRINLLISVPGKFHILQFLEDIFDNRNYYRIITSSPKLYKELKTKNKKNISVLLIIKPFQLISKILKIKVPRWLKYFDSIIFDFLVSIFISKKIKAFYGFAGNSKISASKAKKYGCKVFLDRACPHVMFQENLLLREGKKSGYIFKNNILRSVNRSIIEYELCERIIIPSGYTYNSFKKYGLKNKTFQLPLRHNQKFQNKKYKFVKDNNKIVFGMLGGNPLRKGVFYLLKAWHSFKYKNNSKLILKSRRDLLVQSKHIKSILDKNTSIVVDETFYQDIYEFYAKIDVFCLPSIDDGFGMVVAEAARCSKPVIVSNHVGASDIVDNYDSGLIYNYDNTIELSKCLEYYIANPKKIKLHGNNLNATYKNYLKNRLSYIKSLKEIIGL